MTTTQKIIKKLVGLNTWCSGYPQDIKSDHGGEYISFRIYSQEDDDYYDPDYDEREWNLDSSIHEILEELNRFLFFTNVAPHPTATWYYCDSRTNRWGVHIDACIQIHNNNNN
jgi:hypothetical protein